MRLRLVLVSCIVGAMLAGPAGAVVCQKKKSGVLRVAAACKRSEVPFEGALGPVGPPGAPGSDGLPGPGGELRIYGDGSAGAGVADSITSLETTNLQFTDLTIPTGATTFVASGTVIRCTGTFTNNGTLVVGDGAEGARFFFANTNSVELASRGAHPGVSRGAAMSGERAMGVSSNPGAGGTALEARQARRLLVPGVVGGGGGGYGSGQGGSGGTGGGSVTILAATAVLNNGVIDASSHSQQTFGTGGGAGGVIIIASRGSISNNGVLRADGTEGGDSFLDGAGGGGGGGGLVHLLAPVINAVGSVSVAGGPPGAQGSPGSVTTPFRYGGGGGGACGGQGGQGGDVNNSSPGAASAGSPGQTFESLLDPTSLF
ncbi:MAG TPA: hypothetical protein VGR62_01870 [Candidatus Binatia bacterium]|jgi:hypothetical protein|nr:hypothetical protein [Candidatus Binatia bacterium]